MRLLFFLLIVSLTYAQQSPNPGEVNTPLGSRSAPPKEDKSTVRPVHGIVQDASGNPVSEAVVELKNLKTGKALEAITRKDGSYRFDDLKTTDDYELRATHAKLASSVKRLSTYDPRKDPIVNLDLK